MPYPVADTFRCASGGSIAGGRYYVPWAPEPGEIKTIGYAKNAHPQGLPATLEEIDPRYQAWNPAAPGQGPWGGSGAAQYYWNTAMAYGGGVMVPGLRKLVFFQAGHSAINVPVPFAIDLPTLSCEWLGTPVPSDGLVQTRLHGGDATASTVELYYPAEQFDTAWGDWQGDYSGWPEGFGQPGKIFAESSHSYHGLQYVPGADWGNTNGVVIPLGRCTGITTGTDMLRSHYWDLDTDIWGRLANKPSSTQSTAAGGGCYLPNQKKLLFMGRTATNGSVSVVDVLDIATRTWSSRTAASGIPVVIYDGGLRYFPDADLVLTFPNTNSSDTPTDASADRQRIYAARASDILAGNWAWTRLTLSVTSWPLRTDGKIWYCGWSYCPLTGAFYALNGRNGASQIWKLTPPVGASTAAEYMSGTWSIGPESMTGTLVSKTSAGTAGDSFLYSRMQWDQNSRSFIYQCDDVNTPFQAIRPQGT